MRHVKLPGLMTPAERMARVAASASDVARRALTRKSGTVVVQSGDGTKTVLGEGAGTDGTGAAVGVAQWVGDTVPPGVPTGISCSSSGGVLTVSWDGTLESGLPADFAAVDVYVAAGDGGELYLGELAGAGSLSTSALEQGSAVEVTASARDAARDEDGNPAPNSSARCEPIAMLVSSTLGSEEAEQIRQDAADAADKAEQAEQAADGAAKVATNYISEGEEGLVVGNVAAGELGANTLIRADGVDIREGSEVLASFGPDEASIGENSAQSTVYLCGRKGVINYLESTSGTGQLSLGASPGPDTADCSVVIAPNAAGDQYLRVAEGRVQGMNASSIEMNTTMLGLQDYDVQANYRYFSMGSLAAALASLFEPVSVSLTPNTALNNYSNYANSSRCIGDAVHLQCAVMLSTATDWASSELTLFTLPEEFRPSEEQYMPRMCLCVTGNGGTGCTARGLRVYPDGRVRFVNLSSGTAQVASAVIPGIVFYRSSTNYA